jgi:hypothetical protein
MVGSFSSSLQNFYVLKQNIYIYTNYGKLPIRNRSREIY